MNKIYGWYPSKINDSKLVFEFVDWIEKVVDEDFINNPDVLDKLHNIQNLIEEFHDEFLKDKPNNT